MSAPRLTFPYSGGGGGGGITGSGTAGYVAKFTGTGTSIGDSLVRDNGTDVSIDMAPVGGYKFSVNGNVTAYNGRIDALTGSINTLSSRASNDLVLQRDGVEAARIIAGGLVGIGCTNPANTLETYASTASGIRASSDTLANIGIFQYSGTATGASLTLRKSGGTRAIPAAVATGDTIGTVQFSAYGTGGNVVSSIASSVVAYTSPTNISSNLTFGTSPSGSAAAVTRLTIDSAGNTIVGQIAAGFNTAPFAPLQVTGPSTGSVTSSLSGILRVQGSSSACLFVGSLSGTPFGMYIQTNGTPYPLVLQPAGGSIGVGGVTAPATNTLDVSTAGWGVRLPATPANGDANTLDCYEEGTWTPVDRSGASLSFTAVAGTYTRVGRTVIAQCTLTYPSTANTSDASFSLPVAMTSANTNFGGATIGSVGTLVKNNVTALIKTGATPATDNRIALITYNGAGTVTNANMSLVTIVVSVMYNVA